MAWTSVLECASLFAVCDALSRYSTRFATPPEHPSIDVCDPGSTAMGQPLTFVVSF
jgi:hypothetical protein